MQGAFFLHVVTGGKFTEGMTPSLLLEVDIFIGTLITPLDFVQKSY
jgi:hypothetical protein